MILDEQFGNFLRRKFEDHPKAILTNQRLEEAIRYFSQNIRTQFNPYDADCPDNFPIPFTSPDISEMGVRNNYLLLHKLRLPFCI